MSEALVIKKVLVKAGQSVYDIAVQEYGTAEAFTLVLQANPGLNATSELVHGQELIIWTDKAIEVFTEFVNTPNFAQSALNLLMHWSGIAGGIAIPVDASKAIIIPELHLRVEGLMPDFKDKIIKAWFISNELEFLNYNPVIWLFRWTKANYRYNLAKPSWANRGYSTKWRHPVKWDENDPIQDRKVEFDCPVASNQKVTIDFEIEKWAVYDEATDVLTMKRKSRSKLQLTPEDTPGTSVSINFGLAIAIDNPVNKGLDPSAWVRPYKIWGEITPFRLLSYIKVDDAIPPNRSYEKVIKQLK